ncbi:MAG: histidine phosphatase family protein, partial [Clostridia bacterium]
MKSYTIHLIRHGLCEGNLKGRYIGRTESPLSFEGIKELIDIKSKADFPYAESFYASPSTRCVDSLKILYPDAEPSVILEMAEIDFGDWENMTARELEHNKNFKNWVAGTKGVNPPNGESNMVFMQRVCKGFETLVTNMLFSGNTSAVLVTHAGVIMTILAMYGLPKASMTDWAMGNGQGYSIRFDASNWSRSNIC